MPTSRRCSKNASKVRNSRANETKERRLTSLNERPSIITEEFSAENKVGGRRVSRVDAILDEFMKETLKQPSLGPSSPADKKSISVENLDISFEKVVMNKETETKVTKQTKRLDRRSKAIASLKEDKENLARQIANGDHVVDLQTVTQKSKRLILEEMTVKTENGDKPKLNKLNIRKRKSIYDIELVKDTKKQSLSPDPPRMNIIYKDDAPQSSEDKPLGIIKLSELKWNETTNQDGISIHEIFSSHNSSVGYIKIDANCSYKKTSSSDQIFIVNEGSGDIMINDQKTKLGPGDMVEVSSGCLYEFLNRGRKKSLIMSYVLWK